MGLFRTLTTPTPDGDFHMLLDDTDVVMASGFGTPSELSSRLPEAVGSPLQIIEHHSYQRAIERYYEGNIAALDSIPRQQQGSDFQKKVWQTISNIPYGSTLSYKELAKASGNDAAIRAAGTICGLNKLILLVPCHRVVKSDGGIGNYLYGPAIKQSLLKREGVL